MISRLQWTSPRFDSHRLVWWLFVATAMFMSGVSVALAGPREQAERIHDRLAGVPPSDTVLATMEAAIAGNASTGPIAAANIAMQNPNFYGVTLKNFAAPW